VLARRATRSHRACAPGYLHRGLSPASCRFPRSRSQQSLRVQQCLMLEAPTTSRWAYRTTQFYASIGGCRRLRLPCNHNVSESQAASAARSPVRDGSTEGRSCERRWVRIVRALANAVCCTLHRGARAGKRAGVAVGRTALGCAGVSFVDFAIVVECRRRPPVWASALIGVALAGRQGQRPLESESEVAGKSSIRRPTCDSRFPRLSSALAAANPMSVHGSPPDSTSARDNRDTRACATIRCSA
jgi:hypothetical protein